MLQATTNVKDLESLQVVVLSYQIVLIELSILRERENDLIGFHDENICAIHFW